ncbi:MAG TPA: hypothetical protein VFU17_05335 [Candidatus Limnocylindrales bacterium]|nr:hypothetical protein [Candidatus Limnocylindrales bacterium]
MDPNPEGGAEMPAFPVKLHVAPEGVYANAALKSGASKLLFPIVTGTAPTGTDVSAAARKEAIVTSQYVFMTTSLSRDGSGRGVQNPLRSA